MQSVCLSDVSMLFVQKAAPSPPSPALPVENTGANPSSVGTDMMADPTLIIKDRSVSEFLINYVQSIKN